MPEQCALLCNFIINQIKQILNIFVTYEEKLFLVRLNMKHFIQSFFKTYKSPRIKDGFLEILFYDRNQEDCKIPWGLGGGFLSILLSFVC